MLQTSGAISLVQIGQEYQLLAPYKMSNLYGVGGLPTSGWMTFSSFYGKSMFQVLLSDKTFEVYTTKTSIIPIANILDGSIDQFSGGNNPLTLISVQSPINGTVIINDTNVEFTSTGASGVAASFEYTARNSIGIEESNTVSMTVVPIPPIICNPDSYTLQQGETMLMSKSSLSANDIDGGGYTLTVTWVGNAIGGVVSLNGDNISFVSTGLSGQPAQFDYSVQNTIGTVQSGKVYINITPLPEQEYYLYNSNAEATQALADNTPPTVLDIFETWGRYDGNNWYDNKAAATAAGNTNATAWQFLTVPDRVSMPLNVSPANGFISPDFLDNYTFETTLKSTSADNDTVGLVIAFIRIGSYNHNLVLSTNTGGTAPAAEGYGVWYDYQAGAAGGYGIDKGSKIVGGIGGGWSGKTMRVKVQRQGNIIKCYGTNWNDVDNYQISSEIIIDLSLDTDLQKFMGPQKYGYMTFSQPDSTYLDISVSGGLDKSKIFDATTGIYYEYINGVWVDTGMTVQDEIGYIRKVTNPDTNQRFLVKETTIDYLGKLVANTSFSSTKVLSTDQLILLGSASGVGAASGIQVVGLYENGKEEKNYLDGTATLSTTATYHVAGYNYMGTHKWFEDNGIDIGTLDFAGGTVVFSNGIVGYINSISNGSTATTETAYIYYTPYSYTLYDKTI